MNLKETILEISEKIGFQRTVIASLEPMDLERKYYELWLSKDYAADMNYLKRDPYFRSSPQMLLPKAVSAIIVFASYYTHEPESPGNSYGRVAKYAVGLDYHAVIRAKLRELKNQIEEKIGRPILGKAFTDDVALFEQGLAARSGLGFKGKNSLIIGPKLMGSFHFIGELLTDLPLEADEKYRGTCGDCFRCSVACPTDAIVAPKTVDARRCISYLTIENKGGIPTELRSKLGSWLFGCDICQDVCPYNQRPPETKWKEFHASSGVGHYVDLAQILQLQNDEEFLSKFGQTPLRRPKRRGLTRNALVVIGNQRPENLVSLVYDFASKETDPMLREHAAWALAQYKEKDARQLLEKLYKQETDEATQAEMHNYLMV